MCRKFHGAAFATIAGVPAAHFQWLSGERFLKSYTAENGTTRRFCGECGSSLTFHSPRAEAGIVEVALGVFDGDLPVRPDAHIFVASGASWMNPEDNLPVYSAGRDSQLLKKK